MIANRADSVRLSDGEVAYVIKGGNQHPLTRQPLAQGQVAMLLREMAPAEVSARIAGDESFEFSYANAEGSFLTRVMRDGKTLRATLSPEPVAESVPVSAVSGLMTNGADLDNGSGSGAGSDGQHGASMNGASQTGASPNGAVQDGASNNEATQHGPSHNGTMQRPASNSVAIAHATRVMPVNQAAHDEVGGLLRSLVDEGASDLHLRVGEPPILRVNGELKRMESREPLTGAKVEAMLHSIMPERNQAEYRESNDTDFAYEIEGLARFRGNAFRDHHGAGGVFRVVPATVATVEKLGISAEVQNLCYLTKGLVLVTGPTGSGKSTTLGGLIDLINRSRNDHVITIEDPIEFVHHNKKCVITQRQVGVHTGSYKSALRAALREDPDVVLIGELRDLETISIALETAETGHLVFGTLHTTTAVGTIDRVIDQFPADRQNQIRVMLADTLKGVISQTLCKKIGGGRVAAREILLSLPAVANMIREGKAFQLPSVMQTSRKLGMIQLGDVLIDLVDQGIVSPHEAFVKSTDKPAFMTMLKNRGHDTSAVLA